MNTEIKNYNFSIDFIRGIAIIFVVILHILSLEQFQSNQLEWWLKAIVESVAKSGVPLFIMISGYLLLATSKITKISDFYKKRLARIGIPILFWTLFYYVAYNLYFGQNINLTKFLYDIFYLNIFYHLYFLYIILGLYLLTPFFINVYSKTKRIYKLLIIAVLFTSSLLYMFIHYYTSYRYNYWTILTVFIPFIPYYLVGDYLRSCVLTYKRFMLLLILYFLILCSTLLVKFNISSNIKLENQEMYLSYLLDALSINVFTISIITFLLLLYIGKSKLLILSKFYKKFFKNISNLSFGIYLIHPFILSIVDKYPIYKIVKAEIPIIAIITNFIIVFFSSAILTYIISKIPYIRMTIGNR